MAHGSPSNDGSDSEAGILAKLDVGHQASMVEMCSLCQIFSGNSSSSRTSSEYGSRRHRRDFSLGFDGASSDHPQRKQIHPYDRRPLQSLDGSIPGSKPRSSDSSAYLGGPVDRSFRMSAATTGR